MSIVRNPPAMVDMTIRIAHVYPELLNLYGDTGNVTVLRKRAEWRGMRCDIRRYSLGDDIDLTDTDIMFVGGGADSTQRFVCGELMRNGDAIRAFFEDGGVILAVCGGYQLLGTEYALGDETLPGIGLVDIRTERGDTRLIGNVVIDPIDEMYRQDGGHVVGFENHGGRTYLGSGVRPFAKVVSGYGNDGESGFEGVVDRNLIGTYLHGPLLPKNPHIADAMIRNALVRRTGDESISLPPLDDGLEAETHRNLESRIVAENDKRRHRLAPWKR